MVKCSVAWSTFIHSNSSSEPASSSIVGCFVCDQNRCGWEAEELGQKAASSLRCDTAVCSKLLISQLVRLNDGSVCEFLSNSMTRSPASAVAVGAAAAQTDSHRRWLFNTAVPHMLIRSMSVQKQKNKHVDHLFSRQPPLWSFFYSPTWCLFIHFNHRPMCSSIRC